MSDQNARIQDLELGTSDPSGSVAVDTLALRIASSFAQGLKRALPFLARQRATVTPTGSRVSGEAPEDMAVGPGYFVRLSSSTSVWAALQLDTDAISALLSGLFPSAHSEEDEDDSDPDEEDDEEEGEAPEHLTLAQRALLGRLARDLCEPLVAAVAAQCSVALSVNTSVGLARAQAPDLPNDAYVVDLIIRGIPELWRVRLTLSELGLADVIAAANAANIDRTGPGMAAAVLKVPVDMVAELGRVTLKLSEVLQLRSGDTLRLPSATNDPVVVRVGGIVKFHAVPVISRGQVSVKIQSRHTE